MEQNNFIEWRNKGKYIDNSDQFKNFEENNNIVLPQVYKKLVRFCDGGVLKKDLFYYQYQNDNWKNCIGRFLYWDFKNSSGYYSKFLNVYNDPPEFFPKGLIPFAPDGGGNYICFDYRNCKENPTIVYWDHGIEENEGVFFLADSFEEFINSLKSEEEIDLLNDS